MATLDSTADRASAAGTNNIVSIVQAGAWRRGVELAIVKEAKKLAKPANRGCSGMRYDAKSRRAYFLQHAHDGLLGCFTFDDIASLEQAEELWAEIVDSHVNTVEGLIAAYELVTGRQAEIIGTRQ